MPVYCEDCTNLSPTTLREPPWRWLCLAAPQEPPPSYLKRGLLDGEPYARCRHVNRDGECPMYEPCKRIAGYEPLGTD
jgi:hypothetical protein